MRMNLVLAFAMLTGTVVFAQEPEVATETNVTATVTKNDDGSATVVANAEGDDSAETKVTATVNDDGTVTVVANKEGDEPAEIEWVEKEGEAKDSSTHTTKVHSSFNIVMVDDDGKVITKTIKVDGDHPHAVIGEKLHAGAFELKMDEGKSITIQMPDGSKKTIDLRKAGADVDKMIEVRVVGKEEAGEGTEKAIKLEVHASAIADEVRKSLEGLDLEGVVDAKQIAEQIHAAIGEVVPGKDGTKLMKFGRAIVLDGKPMDGTIDIKPGHRIELRRAIEGKAIARDSSSAVLEKLDAIMKRMDQIESDLAELKKSKE
jgi:hypothetical protein